MRRKGHDSHHEEESRRALTETLITDHIGLVYAAVKRFEHRGTERSELVQAGYAGLARAAEKWKSVNKNDDEGFAAYAFGFIVGEVKDCIRNNALVHIPKDKLKQISELKKVADALEVLSCEDELCFFMYYERFQNMASLEQLFEAETAVSSGRVPKQESFEAEAVNRLDLAAAIAALEQTEQKIIKARYYHDLTQVQTARLLRISQSAVSKIEKQALYKLKQILKQGK